MDSKAKQWSAEETSCLLAVWSSQEIQKKLEGSTRTKAILEEIGREISKAGFDRSVDQISNKLKKLKKHYREQKKDLERSGIGCPRSNPNFEVLDAVLGDRPSCRPTGAFNSMGVLELTVDDSLKIQSYTDDELSAIEEAEVDVTLQPPLTCSSPSPSSSSAQDSQMPCPRQVKRKRDSTTELLHLLERADEREERLMQREERLMQREERLMQREERLMQREERLMQQSEDMHALLLQQMERTEAQSQAFLGLMGRMVAVMEAQGRPT